MLVIFAWEAKDNKQQNFIELVKLQKWSYLCGSHPEPLMEGLEKAQTVSADQGSLKQLQLFVLEAVRYLGLLDYPNY